MEPKKIKGGKGPERKIQDDIIIMMRGKSWHVMETHGNAYQSGFPDLYCCHYRYGARWIDVKNPGSYKFTSAQLEHWPLMTANKAGVWILVAATELEYKKLFAEPNYWQYLSVWKSSKSNNMNDPLDLDE